MIAHKLNSLKLINANIISFLISLNCIVLRTKLIASTCTSILSLTIILFIGLPAIGFSENLRHKPSMEVNDW